MDVGQRGTGSTADYNTTSVSLPPLPLELDLEMTINQMRSCIWLRLCMCQHPVCKEVLSIPV